MPIPDHAAIATTLDNPAGTFVSPYGLQPQATTVPFDCNAKVCAAPTAMAIAFDNPADAVDYTSEKPCGHHACRA